MHPANTSTDKFGEDSSGCQKPPIEPPPGNTYHVGHFSKELAASSWYQPQKRTARIHSGRQSDSGNSITGSGRKMNVSLLWTQNLATLGTARRVDNRNAYQQELHERHTGLKKWDMTPGPWTTIWILKAPLGSGTGHSDSGRAMDVPSGTWTHQQSPRSGTRQAVVMCCIRDHRPPHQYKDHTQGRRPRDKALPSARRKNTANIHRAWIRMPRRSGFSERDYDRQTHTPNRRRNKINSKAL